MYRVVIVEDDGMIAMLDRKFVEQDGRFQVEQEFSNGRSALAYLTSHPVDLLILDVYMPLLTGVELLRELRQRGILTEAIMVTAANDPQTVDGLLKLGVVDYLVKPFTYQRFCQALDAFCRHQELMGAEKLDQEALDRVLFVSHTSENGGLPKGMQEKTMERIRSALTEAGEAGHTSESLAAAAGVSVVTARRYGNFLVEHGGAVSEVNYDTGGRPSLRYRLSR